MAKGIAPIFFTACGVVVAGVVGYSVFEPNLTPQSVPVSLVEKEPKIKVESKIETQELAKLDVTEEVSGQDQVGAEISKLEPEETIEKIEVELVKPSFDIVRVEKDGSTVIAGQGPANEIVELIDGEDKLAETKINSTGEFVFVLDKPLEPGAHELYLRVMPKEDGPIQSSSFAFVDVPKPNTIGEVTVLLAEAGKPSQVLQKPEVAPEEVAEVDAEQVEVPQVSEAEKEAINGDEGIEVVTATAESSVTLANPEVASPEVTAIEEPTPVVETALPTPVEVQKLAPVLIEAADVENGKIFIAGTGEPLTSINIYLDNELLGTAQVAENGAFLFEGSKQIATGRYDIRADMTKGGASVLARAEVTLVHEPKVAAVEQPKEIIQEEPKPEPQVELEPQEVEAPSPVEEETVEQAAAPEVVSEPEAETQSDVVAAEPESEVDQEQVEAEVQKKEIQTGSAVIIRRGDNLWRVARRNYGAGVRYTTIFDANRDQVRDPHLIYPGQVLKIPEPEQSTE